MPHSDSIKARVEALIRPEIQAISAYQVPPATGMVKLDAMENPYGWPGDLVRQWTERLSGAALNRYPDPSSARLREGLRQSMQVPAEYDILLGNGSDELIQLLALAVAGAGRTVLAPEPSFVMYRMIATFAGMNYVGVALNDEFGLDLGRFIEAIEQDQPALVFLAQPNNPTGNLFGEEKIRRIIEATPGLVVLDEAYTAFTDRDYLPLLRDYDNLVIMRTLSKVGLAGLRLGLLIGSPAWLEQFDKLRLPYNINVLTQLSVEFALEHFDVLRAQTRQIRVDREGLSETLKQWPQLRVYPSEANFLLVRVPEGRARELFDALKERQVLIKCLDGAHPLLQDCLRITVGSPAENQALLEALHELL